MDNDNWFFLSHPLNTDTPLYGGSHMEIKTTKEIGKGDSCNGLWLSIPNHAGTHVDVPYHFLKNGKKLNEYSPEQWIFKNIALLQFHSKPGEILTKNILEALSNDSNLEFLLFKTGFENFRAETVYWQNNPGFDPSVAEALKQKFPKLRAIGFDFISLTGYQSRELGRKAHKEFLKRDILIFEDVSLKNASKSIQEIVALPLILTNGDGAPCTMIAR